MYHVLEQMINTISMCVIKITDNFIVKITKAFSRMQFSSTVGIEKCQCNNIKFNFFKLLIFIIKRMKLADVLYQKLIC